MKGLGSKLACAQASPEAVGILHVLTDIDYLQQQV